MFMIMNVLQVTLIFAVFFTVKYLVNKWVYQENYPEWLNYKPFNCETCCTFWTLLTVYLTLGLSFKIYITLIGGIILAVLNAIAMYVDQMNKTIKIEDI